MGEVNRIMAVSTGKQSSCFLDPAFIPKLPIPDFFSVLLTAEPKEVQNSAECANASRQNKTQGLNVGCSKDRCPCVGY